MNSNRRKRHLAFCTCHSWFIVAYNARMHPVEWHLSRLVSLTASANDEFLILLLFSTWNTMELRAVSRQRHINSLGYLWHLGILAGVMALMQNRWIVSKLLHYVSPSASVSDMLPKTHMHEHITCFYHTHLHIYTHTTTTHTYQSTLDCNEVSLPVVQGGGPWLELVGGLRKVSWQPPWPPLFPVENLTSRAFQLKKVEADLTLLRSAWRGMIGMDQPKRDLLYTHVYIHP